MSSLPMWAALLSCVIWLGLMLGRGGFWRADQRLRSSQGLDIWPNVVVVIPARNEVETISQTVSSLVGQDYPGDVEVVVVDDNSSDGTREAVEKSDRVRVMDGLPLEDGWTGKLWAVHQGLKFANSASPDATYVLLTDADITHHPGNLRELVEKAERESLHLVSLMVRLQCVSVWERLLIPAFVFFFQKLYPFPQVNDPNHERGAAAGGCMLIRADTLKTAGGVEAIKDRIIDDCAMGRLIKEHGPIWLGLTEATFSSRSYHRLSEIWDMVARTAFVQLDHSAVNLLGTVLAMILIYLVPPVAVILGVLYGDVRVVIAGAMGWALMGFSYVPTLKLYGLSVLHSLTLPLAALLYTLMTVSSAIRHWKGRGGTWKGRRYS